jgi:allantoinase
MKRNANFFKVWGGISGVQHSLPLLLTAFGLRGQAERAGIVQDALSLIARLTSFNVAERFQLPGTKGRIAVGADADVALADLKQAFTVRAADLLYRHQQSAYVGRALTGRVIRTILRGTTVFNEGRTTSPPRGRLVKPGAA